MSIIDRIKRAAALTLRAVEFGYYHVLLSTVDRVSRLPRNTTVPEAMRLYRENIALKAQLDALEAELAQRTEPEPVPMVTRAAQASRTFSRAATNRSSATSSRPRCAPSSGGRRASGPLRRRTERRRATAAR